MQVVPLKDLVEDETKLYTVPLVKNMDPNDEANSKKRGELTFEMTFKPFKEVRFFFFWGLEVEPALEFYVLRSLGHALRFAHHLGFVPERVLMTSGG